jgi:class 3 adenylate cyclase
MPRIPILKLGSSTVEIEPPRLASYIPALSLNGIQLGIDNLRHDVWLSPAFTKPLGAHIGKLIAKYGAIEAVMSVETTSPSGAPRNMLSKFVSPPVSKSVDVKQLLLELHKSALSRAKAQANIGIDLLARAAIIKFLRSELSTQFAFALDRCRATLRGYEGVRQQKALEYRETVASFQIRKKSILRQAGQDLFRTLREIERETLARTRRSLFGTEQLADYDIFLNHLLFLEEGRDSFLTAEHYALFGGFENDPDSFGNIRALACEFLKSLEAEGAVDDSLLEGWLNAPENSHELVGTGDDGEKAHKVRLDLWTDLLEREKLLTLAVAAYEVVPLLPELPPLVDPQQLKYALVFRKERDRLEKILEEREKSSADMLTSASACVAQVSGSQRSKTAARFLRDLMRYHRDLRRLEVLNRTIEKINLISSEKLRDLSKLNGTLYEFLLAEETAQQGEKSVLRHVVLKADVRDSSRLTRSLLAREMNPASYFSLNFYEPVNKLLAKYGATKVFVEGDAIILAMLEHEDEPALSVARACVLAREMTEIVGGYNHLLQRSGLPALELGIGISYQDSAPMYLLDGEHRIMISDALNESDRLSSCDKRVRKAMTGAAVPFNVYEFRTGDNGDEPMRYNVSGIRISEAGYKHLREEISLEKYELEFPRLWGSEEAVFYSGLVPVGGDIFRRIVLRESRVPVIDPNQFSLTVWTETPIYEICTNPAVYSAIEKSMAATKSRSE